MKKIHPCKGEKKGMHSHITKQGEIIWKLFQYHNCSTHITLSSIGMTNISKKV